MAFGLYVHWPYCESKCPYCDFNSHLVEKIDAKRWSAAYRHEIARAAAATSDEVLSSIFIGGGTPSLMPPEILGDIVAAAKAAWRCSNDLEVTMEANPSSVEVGRFRAFHDSGVNRVSLGIQALDDQDLRLLGRKHDHASAIRAIDVAQLVFDRVNIDLMYGRQYQIVANWEAELRKALWFGTGHLSLYQLTIEDGTVFGRRHAAGHLPGLPDEDKSVAFFQTTQDLCDSAGLPAYEVSNHARPDQECRHNLTYWRSGCYAAIGPGAHGRMGRDRDRKATEAIRQPSLWLTAVEQHGSGDLSAIQLDDVERATEVLLMGLRLTTGIASDTLQSAGIDLRTWPSRDHLTEAGLLIADKTNLATTPQGRLLLNSVLRELTADLRLRQS